MLTLWKKEEKTAKETKPVRRPLKFLVDAEWNWAKERIDGFLGKVERFVRDETQGTSNEQRRKTGFILRDEFLQMQPLEKEVAIKRMNILQNELFGKVFERMEGENPGMVSAYFANDDDFEIIVPKFESLELASQRCTEANSQLGKFGLIVPGHRSRFHEKTGALSTMKLEISNILKGDRTVEELFNSYKEEYTKKGYDLSGVKFGESERD